MKIIMGVCVCGLLFPLAHLGGQELDKRAAIVKAWARYCNEKATKENHQTRDTIAAMDRALHELKKISKELHEHAATPDPTPYPIQLKPPTDTPPNPEYAAALAKRLSQAPVKN